MTRYAFPGSQCGPVQYFSVEECLKSQLGKLAYVSLWMAATLGIQLGEETRLLAKSLPLSKCIMVFTSCVQAIFTILSICSRGPNQADKQIYKQTFKQTHTLFRKQFQETRHAPGLKSSHVLVRSPY